MVNGPNQTYIERKGKLELANIKFRDEEHLFQVAQRIVNRVGRRVDQTTPLADARLADGSRVNVIVPPLSLKGTAIRSEEHTSELQSLMRISYAVCCLKKKTLHQATTQVELDSVNRGEYRKSKTTKRRHSYA